MRLISAIALLKYLDARYRLFLSIAIAGLLFLLLPSSILLQTRLLVIWNAGVLFLLTLVVVMMSNTTLQQMRRRVQNQDESRTAILVLVVSAASASLFAIGVVLGNTKGLSAPSVAIHVGLSVVAIVCSWLLTHTSFALHYAHNYYSKDESPQGGEQTGGLIFPGEELPDYWDFVYFSFVIGMTSQVSDVAIGSRSMRRLATIHGILSFVFNTAILALSINIIAGLI